MQNAINIIQKYIFFIYFLLFFLVNVFWILGNFPAVMSFDSISQWKMLESGIFESTHPFLHSFLVYILKNLFGSPVAVAVFQSFTHSLLFAGIFVFLEKLKINKYLKLFLIIFSVLSPVYGIYNVTLWKDIIFAQIIVFLGILVYIDIDSKKPLTNPKLLLLISLLSTILPFIRYNGILYIAFVPFLYLLLFHKQYKYIFLLFTSNVAIYLIFTFVVLPAFQYQKLNQNYVNSITKIQILAAVVNDNAPLHPHEIQTINKLINIEDIKSKYNCSAIDYLYIGQNDFNKNVLEDEQYYNDFQNVSLDVIYRNLPSAIGDRFCLFSHLIGLGEPRWQYLFEKNIIQNDIGLYQQPVKFISKLTTNYLTFSEQFPQRIIFWNHLIVLLIYLVAWTLAIVKKNPRVFALISIILLNVPVIFLAGVARDFRYLYMLTLGLPLVIGLIFHMYSKDNLTLSKNEQNHQQINK